MSYFCTCNKGKKTEVQEHTTYYPTEVTADEICVYCGHYAVINSVANQTPSNTSVFSSRKMFSIEAFRNGVSLGVFKTATDCARALNFDIYNHTASRIYEVAKCKKHYKSYYGYTFREVEI